MTTDNLLLLQANPAGWSPNALTNAAAGENPAPGTSDPAQFLQALLAQMQRGDAPIPQDGKAVAQIMPTDPVSETADSGKTPSATVMDQLKALLTDTAKAAPAATAAATQQPATEAGGNSLPQTTADTSAYPTSPEQLLAYLAQWVAPQTPTQPAQSGESEAAAVHGNSPNTSNKPIAGEDGLPTASDLAQWLQAAGFQAQQPARPAATGNAETQPQEAVATRQAPPQLPAAIKLTEAQSSSDSDEDSTPLQILARNADVTVTPAVKSPAAHATDFNKTLSSLERLSKTDIELPADRPDTEALVMPPIPQDRIPVEPALPQAIVATDGSIQAPMAAPAQTPMPTTATTTATPAPIQTPVAHPGWSQEMSDRIVWMAGQRQGLQTAEIKLNPAHLGPVEVRVNMNQDQASVQFVSNHAAVREALESAVPKLREMLHSQNLNLVDVNVSQHSFDQQQRNDNSAAQFGFGRQSSSQRAEAPETGEPSERGQPTPIAETKLSPKNGLLSLYA
jgi:flagellar hook-length control protein FliK